MKTSESNTKIDLLRAHRNWGIILCAIPSIIVLLWGVLFVFALPEALLPKFFVLSVPFKVIGWIMIVCSPFVFRFLYKRL